MNKPVNSEQYEYQTYYSSVYEKRRGNKRRPAARKKSTTSRQNKHPVMLMLMIVLAVGLLASMFIVNWSTVFASHVFPFSGSSMVMATIDAGAAPTATPFMPNAPTAVPVAILPPEDMPVSVPAELSSSAATEKIVKQSGQVYIMLLGSDQRLGENGFRTDEIMLLSINRLTFQVSVVSFPRDLYVDIPGDETTRINTAMGKGGFEMLADTFETNFGFRPDFYVMTNFWSFVEVVDSLGGLEIHVPEYLEDKCEPPKTGTCSVDAGDMTMDGETALWYVRSRRTTSDFERTKRGREVLHALFVKLMSLDAVTHFPDLYKTYTDYVETNMGIDDMISLLPVATVLVKDSNRIHFYHIGPEVASDYFAPNGAQVLLPDFPAIHNILVDALSK